MKALVVYDSAFGNTAEVARTVGRGLGADTIVEHIADADVTSLREFELVVVGSPTQGGKPTTALTAFLARIPVGGLENIPVAAFDTRILAQKRGLPLRFLMQLIGYAAPRIGRTLTAKGGQLAAPPEGFIVDGKEGPLSRGELGRAEAWARMLIRAVRPALS